MRNYFRSEILDFAPDRSRIFSGILGKDVEKIRQRAGAKAEIAAANNYALGLVLL